MEMQPGMGGFGLGQRGFAPRLAGVVLRDGAFPALDPFAGRRFLDAERRGEFGVDQATERFVRQARKFRSAIAADEAAEQYVTFRGASRQYGRREQATEYVAAFAARGQVAEPVERMRDVLARVTAGHDGHRRNLRIFPVPEERRDGFVEGKGAPMPAGRGDDQMLRGDAFVRPVRAAPSDVPAARIAAE